MTEEFRNEVKKLRKEQLKKKKIVVVHNSNNISNLDCKKNMKK